jgi:hypothetical protein
MPSYSALGDACKLCDNRFPLMDSEFCGLCIKASKFQENSVPDSKIHEMMAVCVIAIIYHSLYRQISRQHIRNEGLQCQSCSLVFPTSTTRIDICSKCLLHWGKILPTNDYDLYALMSLLIEEHEPPVHLLVLLSQRRTARSVALNPTPQLAEPTPLFNAHITRAGSANPSWTTSLATQADIYRQDASHTRLSGKPTTSTATGKFTSMTPGTYKASKSQISHHQKMQASAGGNIVLIATLWEELDNQDKLKKARLLKLSFRNNVAPIPTLNRQFPLKYNELFPPRQWCLKCSMSLLVNCSEVTKLCTSEV